ncbi:MAG: FHA domain-containing protein [Deltaproteobacteria bacterium]|nr:FHA domain-containing protein [Deltaproteobacteria bacterium]
MLPYWRPNTVIVSPLITTVVVQPPAGEIRLLPLVDEMIIGRGHENEIHILEDMLSRRHARLRQTPQGLVIDDMGSENGTHVTRQLIPGVPHLLHVGDTVLLGRSRISFVHQLPPAPPLADDVARLIAAICKAPEDDEPRLVLADLLTARGDPRGEFISYQIAAETSVNTEAASRADALLARHELDWLAPLPIPLASWTFRRGFLDCVWVRPGQTVAPLRGHHPLRAAVTIA